MEKNKELADRISVFEFFYTIVGWTMFVLVNTILFCVTPFVLLFSLLFDRDKKALTYMIKLFYHIFYFLNFFQKTDFDKNGLTSPKKGERRIYVLNHSSMFDVILMFLMPGPIKSIMKESYAKIPIIGWVAILAGNIVLKENSSSGNQIDVYMKCIEKLENGSPVVIYPEGTKSKDSKIGKFYHGTFKIALETKADLVPVVFDTWNVIRPGELWIRDVHHTIKILDTIKYEEFKDMDYKEISKNVRIKLIDGLLKIRDNRRNNSKSYYRHKKKFIEKDNEMKEELIKLKEKLKVRL